MPTFVFLIHRCGPFHVRTMNHSFLLSPRPAFRRLQREKADANDKVWRELETRQQISIKYFVRETIPFRDKQKYAWNAMIVRYVAFGVHFGRAQRPFCKFGCILTIAQRAVMPKIAIQRISCENSISRLPTSCNFSRLWMVFLHGAIAPQS